VLYFAFNFAQASLFLQQFLLGLMDHCRDHDFETLA